MSAAIHTSRTVPVTVPRIARSLYSILFLCVSMFLLVLPATFLYFRIGGATERKRRRLHRFICRASRFIVRRVPGTCFTLDNSVGERFDKPAVIISNHQSHLDLMCILMLTPNLVVLTNDWVHRNPIYGLVIRYAEFYAVSDGIEANLGRLADLVRRGYSIVVFPEGTRSPDCRIGRFHRGAFYLAEQLHLDLLPIYLHGVGHVLPKRDFMLRRGSMHAEVGRRITPTIPVTAPTTRPAPRPSAATTSPITPPFAPGARRPTTMRGTCARSTVRRAGGRTGPAAACCGATATSGRRSARCPKRPPFGSTTPRRASSPCSVRWSDRNARSMPWSATRNAGPWLPGRSRCPKTSTCMPPRRMSRPMHSATGSTTAGRLRPRMKPTPAS